MKRIIYTILIGSTIFILGCKKPDEVPAPIEGRDQADDASARSEMQRAYDDVETVFNSQDYQDASNLRTTSSLRTTTALLPCGRVTFNLNNNSNNFSIDYSQSGSNCTPYRILSGSIDVTLVNGTTFADVDAKLKLVFNNYKVLYTNSNQSVTYTGTTYITNTSGGSLFELTELNSKIIHSVRGDLQLKFDTLGSATFDRSWKIFRKRTFENTTGTPSGITFKLEGDTSFAASTYFTGTNVTAQNFSKVGEIGINVKNEKFVCDMSTDFIWSNCGSTYAGPYVLKQGKVEYVSYTSNATLVAWGYTKYYWSAAAGYRTDATGASIYDGSCDSDGYKLDFSLQNGSGASIYAVTAFQAY